MISSAEIVVYIESNSECNSDSVLINSPTLESHKHLIVSIIHSFDYQFDANLTLNLCFHGMNVQMSTHLVSLIGYSFA